MKKKKKKVQHPQTGTGIGKTAEIKKKRRVKQILNEAKKDVDHALAIEKAKPAADMGKLIFCCQAERGRRYLNWTRHQVMVFKYEQNDEYVFTAYCDGGDIVEVRNRKEYPLIDDLKEANLVFEIHERKRFVLARRAGQNTLRFMEGDLDGEGNPVKKVKKKGASGVKRNRGPVNDKTGYGEGTDGNTFALIILKHGTSKDVKKKALAEIFDICKERFDEKKAKGLASSWYSTVKRKNPSWWTEAGEEK